MDNENDLAIGEAYFMVSYFDDKYLVPKIETYIYVGKNILDSKDQKDIWYFQNPTSYLTQGPFNTLPPADYDVYQIDQPALEYIYSLNELATRLINPHHGY